MALDKFYKFKFQRGANPGVGQDYEKVVTALMGARLFYMSSPDLLKKREYDDFDLGFNLKDMGKFDDLVVLLKKNQKPLMNVAVQLKHKERGMLTETMLLAKTGNFSLKTYSNSAATEIKYPIDQFVLFTNLSFHSKTSLKGYKDYNIEQDVKNTVFNFLNTSLDDNAVFIFTPTTTTNPTLDEVNFFKKFSLYSNQLKVTQMKQELKRTLKNEFNADEYSQKIFLDLCSNWCNNIEVKDVISGQPRLDRKRIGKMLVVSLLNPFLVTVQVPLECEKQWEILTKAAKKFTVTVVDSDVCKNWTFPLEDNSYSLWANKSTELLIIKTLESHHSNQVLKAVHIMHEIGLDKKIIILGSVDTKKFREEVNMFMNLGKLDKNLLEEVLTEFYLPFEIVLKLFKMKNEVVLSEVTPSLLFDMITNEDKRAEEELPECYVSRTVEAPIIFDISIIPNIIYNAFIFLIIDNHLRDVEGTLKKIGNNIPFVEMEDISKLKSNSIVRVNNKISVYDALNAFRKSHLNKNVYFFKIFAENAELEWILSDGPSIQKLENPKKKEINENALSTDFYNKINILCAEPGMGKSTTLKVLHNQLLLLNYYPKLISFKDHVAFFKTFNNSDSAESILKHFLNIQNINVSNLAIICALSKGRVCLLFDAIDELDSKYLSKAIECVEKLLTFTNYNLKIWISTRKHLKDQVENAYEVHSLDLSLIIEEDQKEYIRARLNLTYVETTIQTFISNIYENFTLFEQNSDVLGIPLQLFIITEVLIDCVDENEDTDIKNLMVLTKLYHEFFKGKIGHALEKNKKYTHLDKLCNINKYEIVALKVCLNESDFNSLEIKRYDKSVQDVKKFSIVGIVTNFNNDGAIFEHQTFAEYFCASYFANNLKTNVNLKKFIFQPKYNTIRMFLNMKLSEESSLHLAVIYRNLEIIINADKNEIKSCKDEGGRNLLQVAICCGVNYPPWQSFDNDEIYEAPTKFSFDVKLENILKYLSSICNFEEIDKLFKWSSYEYATNMNDLSIINIMFDFKPISLLLQKHCFIQKEYVLGYSAIYGFINLVKILCLKFSINLINEVKFKNNSIGYCKAIHFAIENGQVDCLKFLIKNNVDINATNLRGITTLHLAAYEGHLQCLQELIAKSDEVNCKDVMGWTPLHAAAHGGQLQCLQELIARGGKVNSERSNDQTPLHLAAQEGHLQCLQELIAKGGEVNSKNSNGRTPLHLAAQEGHLKCLQELIAKGGEVNSKNANGWTPLYFAAYRGHLPCLEELIANGGEVNSEASDGRTPLHLAAQGGHLQCLDILIANGGDVNFKNSNDLTPLQIVAENGH